MAGVVNVVEKVLLESIKCELGRRTKVNQPKTRRELLLLMSKPSPQTGSGQAWGEPACCPGGIRRIGGASLVQASTWNVGSCDPDTAPGEADG